MFLQLGCPPGMYFLSLRKHWSRGTFSARAERMASARNCALSRLRRARYIAEKPASEISAHARNY